MPGYLDVQVLIPGERGVLDSNGDVVVGQDLDPAVTLRSLKADRGTSGADLAVEESPPEARGDLVERSAPLAAADRAPRVMG